MNMLLKKQNPRFCCCMFATICSLYQICNIMESEMKRITAAFLLLMSIAFISCREETNENYYNNFLQEWTSHIRNKNYSVLNKYEFISKTESEYAEIYSDYYFKNIVLFGIEDIDSKTKKIKFGGKVVKRSDLKESDFIGDAYLSKDSSGLFKIKNKTIVSSN